eukprot:2707600-Amphidinium_carterae.1
MLSGPMDSSLELCLVKVNKSEKQGQLKGGVNPLRYSCMGGEGACVDVCNSHDCTESTTNGKVFGHSHLSRNMVLVIPQCKQPDPQPLAQLATARAQRSNTT